MVAENAVMPSAASRSERIIFSFVQLLAGRLLPKNSIRFSPRRAIVLRGNTCRIKFVSHLAAHSSDVGCGSRSYGDGGKSLAPLSLCENRWSAPMTQVDDLSRSLIAFEQNSTMVVVLEMSQSSWLAAGVVPGIERRPLKKLDPDPTALLRLVEGWRDHAMKA